MRSIVVAVASIAVIVTAALAQSDAVWQRKELMKANGQNAGALDRMVRGEDPYDASKVDAAFAQFSESAQKAPNLFSEPPKPGEETRALPKIWETKSDFDAKMTAFAKAVDENKGKAKTLDELKTAYPAV